MYTNIRHILTYIHMYISKRLETENASSVSSTETKQTLLVRLTLTRK